MTRKKWIYITSILSILLITALFFYRHYYSAGDVGMLSVSSDGRYVITTDTKEMTILWDLKTHQKKIVDRKAHIFSAYFIPNTDNYVWQSQDKIIHIQSVDGTVLKTFKLPFYIYGFAITKDYHYLMAGDIGDGLHYCHDEVCKTLHKPDSTDPSIFTADKPFNLTLSNDEQYILGSGMGNALANDPKNVTGIFLWNVKTGVLVHDYIGNIVQTFATISPDGQYIVAGDNGSNLCVWETNSGKKIVDVLTDEPILKYNSDGSVTGDTNVIPVPADFIDHNTGEVSYSVLSVKFIDATHYLRFSLYVPYAMLYEVTNPKALKYFPLVRHPYPAVDYFQRDQAIDTSPSAHILVMGKENEGGILVYQYDLQTQTLTKVWDGN